MTYVGTVLIAFEFVREFTDFNALAAMTIGYPLLNLKINWNKLTKRLGVFKIPVTMLKNIAAIVLIIIMLPIAILFATLFYIIWVIIHVLDEFNQWVNNFYLNKWRTNGPWVKTIVDTALNWRGKRKDHRTEQRVRESLEKRKIRIIPIIGLILLTIAFVLEFVH